MLRRHKLLIAGAIALPVVLALLGGGWVGYRLFVVRTFYIPTNAMAPAIWGRHKDLACPKCGYPYRVAASEEVYSETGESRGPDCQVIGATCPMCRWTMNLQTDLAPGTEFPSEPGEVIPVAMLAYHFDEPQRWEIAVFEYPADPQVNFHKRIVGLPNETVRIAGGDIFVRPDGNDEFTIARKPPEVVRTMLQVVYDNDYVLPEIVAKGWPPRWSAGPGEAKDSPAGWETSEDGKGFASNAKRAGQAWLRYRHLVPSYEDWQRLRQGPLPEGATPKPKLITDFFAGNTALDRQLFSRDPGPDPESLGLHWVGDLALGCTLQVRNRSGEVTFELVEAGRAHRCAIDLATGEARLSIDGLDDFGPVAATAFSEPGTYEVLFANVDDQLLLRIDGELVGFDGPTTYDAPEGRLPQEADLAPAGIASHGAAVRVSHLKVLRDVYYIADQGTSHRGALGDFDADAWPYEPFTRQAVAALLSDPGRWDAFGKTRHLDFPLGAGQYLVLGDNSARSKDSRLWGATYYVRRDQFIGKVLGR